MFIDEQYIKEIGNQLDLFKKVSDTQYSCRCPFCGDSSKNKFKKRGWFIETKDGSWLYHCFNCSLSLSFKTVLKQLFPGVYSRYLLETFSYKKQTGKVTQKKRDDTDLTPFILKNCIPVESSDLVLGYIKSRKIPETKFKDLTILKDVYNIKDIPKYKDSNLKHEPRLAIPVYDNQGRISYLITRGLAKGSVRYINFSLSDQSSLFGLYDKDGDYKVDLNKTIFVVEGAIDSLFLDNCLAVNNADLLRAIKHFGILSKALDFVFIPDADKRNQEIIYIYKNIIDKGYKVVIFPDWIKGKDINEIILKQPHINIQELIQENIFQGLEAKLKFNNWKKL